LPSRPSGCTRRVKHPASDKDIALLDKSRLCRRTARIKGRANIHVQLKNRIDTLNKK
jgi:hypothetical protein